VVVVAQDALGTITPCLENVFYTMGPRDELIVVDDGSRGAGARILELFAGEHPERTRLVRAEAALGFTGAARLGIAEAGGDFVALLAPNVKVAGGWLDKLIGHLERDPSLALIAPSMSGRRAGEDGPLYAPPTAYAAPGASVLDKLVTAGPRAVRVAPSGCLVGRRALVRELADVPDLIFGARTTALAEHLAARGGWLGAAADVFVRRLNQVGGEHHGPDRARYLELQSAAPAGEAARSSVSVVILLRDNLALTQACIESVYRETPSILAIQLVLVDNGSAEDVGGYADRLRAAGREVVYLRNQRNEGFAYGCNQGIAAARGTFLVLLNNDVVVTPGWLDRQLALLAMDPAIAVVGPTTNATSGAQLVGTATYRGAGEAARFARQWALEHAGELAIVPRIVGLCMVMRRSLIDEIGGFDTAFGFGNCEDDDFCVRVMRAGHQIAIAYDVFIHHHGSSTFRSLGLDARALVDENWQIFCAKWSHPPSLHGPEALAALARAAPFAPDRDRIPPEYARIFHPGAPPLALATRKPVRMLCIPELRAPPGAPSGPPSSPEWRAVLARFFATFSAADPVALVVRVEPPTPAGAEQATRAVAGLLRELGLPLAAAPEIVIDATPLPPASRGSLYSAAAAYLACGGAREVFYRREARACGLPIAELNESPPASPTPVPRPSPSPSPSRSRAAAPLVSVIVPTYNRPRLLEVALRSVRAQTLEDLEIIVVNDAGAPVTDVIERIDRGARRPIRYIENPTNRGHGGSRNVGLRASAGRYVAYLDDDDSFRPDHLATLIGALAGGAAEVAYSDAERAHVQADGVTVIRRDVPYASDFDPDALLLTNFIPMLCVVHRRDCVIGGREERLFDETLPVLEDWDLFIRLSRRFRFQHVPRVTCEFTVRTDGSSVTGERIRLFAQTEQRIRRKHRAEIARSPRALNALYQSLLPEHRRLLAAGDVARAVAELSAFVEGYPECAEARRDLAAATARL
jgi:GT2 family glycosyltransferase